MNQTEKEKKKVMTKKIKKLKKQNKPTPTNQTYS